MLNPDSPNLIISPADSQIYSIATNVSEFDTFWLKGHRYFLKYLLNGDNGGDHHKPYIGGTVYQAYLLPTWILPDPLLTLPRKTRNGDGPLHA